jgi:hypothetical protein
VRVTDNNLLSAEQELTLKVLGHEAWIIFADSFESGDTSQW